MSFRFKQFFVNDDRCAMKVGTDGVLLGAWAPIDRFADRTQTASLTEHRPNYRILDIGTGCGLIALMLQQRCPQAEVEGIDIDEAAVEQARENGVNASCAKLQEWQGGLYDLIVSNPPYFQNSLKNPDKGRQTARHTDTLSYDELLQHSARLLTDNGQLALILPAEAEAEVREMASNYSLYCTRVTRVYSKDTKPVRRVLLSFEISKSLDLEISPKEDTLVLEDEKGGRSRQYQELTKDFYL